MGGKKKAKQNVALEERRVLLSEFASTWSHFSKRKKPSFFLTLVSMALYGVAVVGVKLNELVENCTAAAKESAEAGDITKFLEKTRRNPQLTNFCQKMQMEMKKDEAALKDVFKNQLEWLGIRPIMKSA